MLQKLGRRMHLLPFSRLYYRSQYALNELEMQLVDEDRSS